MCTSRRGSSVHSWPRGFQNLNLATSWIPWKLRGFQIVNVWACAHKESLPRNWKPQSSQGKTRGKFGNHENSMETTWIPYVPKAPLPPRITLKNYQLHGMENLTEDNSAQYEAQIERALLQQEEVKERAKEMAKYKRSSKMQKKFSNLKLRWKNFFQDLRRKKLEFKIQKVSMTSTEEERAKVRMQKSIAQRSYRKKDQDQKKLSEAKIKEPFGKIRSFPTYCIWCRWKSSPAQYWPPQTFNWASL